MIEPVNEARELPLTEILTLGRSIHSFTSYPVTNATLRRIVDLMKWGPTAFNSQPARFRFLRSAAARERLIPALSGSNREKTRKAPMTVIVAYAHRFYDELPPGTLNDGTMQMFRDKPALAQETALRNGTLQGAYFMIAARSLGLAVGPMSGFDPNQVNQTFFADGRQGVNFLINMGYPAADSRTRGHRFGFADVATIE
jgi:3-hydroxypropanoate dehydrogenase